MKRKMVYCCLLICLFAVGNVSAAGTTFKEQTENWLKSSSDASGSGYSGSNDDDFTSGQEPTENPPVPVSDAFLFLNLLAAGYGIILNRKKTILKRNE
ncbi:MAG: hypothetical protein LBM08_01845 [Dysgonamonadaceae bacterium]|jgi:hypothetical protein|nr:hypothetical protein [Dysgonamonadaceae bacterium]